MSKKIATTPLKTTTLLVTTAENSNKPLSFTMKSPKFHRARCAHARYKFKTTYCSHEFSRAFKRFSIESLINDTSSNGIVCVHGKCDHSNKKYRVKIVCYSESYNHIVLCEQIRSQLPLKVRSFVARFLLSSHLFDRICPFFGFVASIAMAIYSIFAFDRNVCVASSTFFLCSRLHLL